MKFIADLHIHSHFSRATSKELVPEKLHLWAQKKGIKVVGTGDLTHPGWIKELKEKLRPAEEGLYSLDLELVRQVNQLLPSICQSEIRFMLTGEISCIYKKGGKVRKIHHLVLMPDFEAVERLNRRLERIGNIVSDGRPILGLDSRDLLEMVLDCDERAFFIPAHIWTPWFSLFGSKSGFDSIEECFEDLTRYIYALETGLSSDPPMNRRLSHLDRFVLVSNSDAHSPGKMGREANIFSTVADYPHMIEAMKTGRNFVGTIEFFPEEGKYHLDGHRRCGLRLMPGDTRTYQGICPNCGLPLTVGVLHRVEELADRAEPQLTHEFISLIPLPEIISEIIGAGPSTKKVLSIYETLLQNIGPEFYILMDAPFEQIEQTGGFLLREAISRMRMGRVIREGGFDGQYGVIRLFEKGEKELLQGQGALFLKPRPKVSIERKKQPSHKPLHRGRTGSRKSQEALSSLADPILASLNKEQLRAVTHQGGHLLVIAGPGTGKTLVLTHRISYLLREGKAAGANILAITFTRKAAHEMEERISKMAVSDSINVNTFHGFCLEVLNDFGELAGLSPPISVCSEVDALNIASRVISEAPEFRASPLNFLGQVYSWRLSQLLGLECGDHDPKSVPLFSAYLSKLKELDLVDFNQLELITLELLLNNPGVRSHLASRFPWIFVDEYQDTNTAQALILKSLVRAGDVRLFVIGDPDQAIYGFRGADVGNFHRFQEDFPGAQVVRLTINYRSTQTILDAASSVMGKAEALESVSSLSGSLLLAPCSTEAEEAEMVVETIERMMGGISHFSVDSGRTNGAEEPLSFGDFAVLTRLNTQADALEEALARRGIPTVRSGQQPITEKFPVNILWRFLQTRVWPQNSLYRDAYMKLLEEYELAPSPLVFRIPTKEGGVEEWVDRAISSHFLNKELNEEQTEILERFRTMVRHFKGSLLEFLGALSLERGIDHRYLLGDRVAIMTIHAAKGLEWEVVFVTGCENGLLPCTLYGARDEEEEKRLFYVALTRARRRLILSWARRRNLNGRLLQLSSSPYLDAIPDKLKKRLERGEWKPKPKAHQQLALF